MEHLCWSNPRMIDSTSSGADNPEAFPVEQFPHYDCTAHECEVYICRFPDCTEFVQMTKACDKTCCSSPRPAAPRMAGAIQSCTSLSSLICSWEFVGSRSIQSLSKTSPTWQNLYSYCPLLLAFSSRNRNACVNASDIKECDSANRFLDWKWSCSASTWVGLCNDDRMSCSRPTSRNDIAR